MATPAFQEMLLRDEVTCLGLTSSVGSGELSALPSAVPYLSLGEDLWE